MRAKRRLYFAKAFFVSAIRKPYSQKHLSCPGAGRRFAASGAGGDIRLRRSPALLKTAADAAFLTAYPQPAAAPRPKDDCGAAALCVAAHNHYAILFRLAMFLLLSSQVFAHFIYHFFLRMCRDAYIRGSLLLPRKNYAQRRNAALGAIKRNRG